MALTISRLDGGPRLILEDAPAVALAFFEWDQGSLRFDEHAAAGDEPDRFTRDDLRAVNTLAARSAEKAWADVLGRELPELHRLDRAWDLTGLDEAAWAEASPAVEAAFELFIAPYRGLAVAAKALHLKRPRLFPILDSLVVDILGGRGRAPLDLMDRVRSIGRQNDDALAEVQQVLRRHGFERSKVRILDALLWSMHPAAAIAPRLGRLVARVSWRSPTARRIVNGPLPPERAT